MGTRFSIRFGGGDGPGVPRDPGAPFRVVLAGDFSGVSTSGAAGVPLAERSTHRLECDGIDDLMARLAPTIEIGLGDGDGAARTLALRFEDREDFYPDGLLARASVFRALRQIKRQLKDPATFDMAAAQLMGSTPTAPDDSAPGPEENGSLLGELLGGDVGAAEAPPQKTPGLSVADRIVQAAVAPYVVDTPHPMLDTCLVQVDQALAGLMRRVLSDEALRAVETSWIAAERLATGIELDAGDVVLDVLDMSADDLRSDLRAGGPGWRQLLARLGGIPGTPRPALVAGTYTFEAHGEDVELLRVLCNHAVAAGVPVSVGVSVPFAAERHGRGTLATADGPPAEWTALRQTPGSEALLATFPDVMARLPYGQKTDPVDAFEFEEILEPGATEAYAWMPASVCVAEALAAAFLAEGWDMHPEGRSEIGGLPVHAYRVNGEMRAMPCTPLWLTDGQADGLSRDWGVVPVLSVRGRDAVRVHLRSLAVNGHSVGCLWQQ